MGEDIKVCQEFIIPGAATLTSLDGNSLAIVYRLLKDDGIQHRIRILNLDCEANHKFLERKEHFFNEST
jgi:hypothetical protein